MIVDPNDLRHDKRPRKKPIYKKKIVSCSLGLQDTRGAPPSIQGNLRALEGDY